jgi:SufS family cysteine desulfurase
MQALENLDLAFVEQFPLLKRGGVLYLDSAATSLKPRCVVERESEFYLNEYATVNRSLYPRAQRATEGCLETRELIQQRIGALDARGVVFTRGTTDGLNQTAQFLLQLLQKGDEILISPLEHHANLLPFKALEEKGFLKIRKLPIFEDGGIDFDSLALTDLSKVRALTIAHVSNVTGVEQNLDRIGRLCKEQGWIFIVDAAQSMAHKRLDVERSQIDFLAFSAHKMYGPTGVGALYISSKFIERLEPVFFGGEMILEIGSKMSFQEPPMKFETGTPPIAQIIGWKEALKFQTTPTFEAKAEALPSLAKSYRDELAQFSHVHLLSAKESDTIVTMSLKGVHPMDMALLLGERGVEVRSGSLCALGALDYFQANSFLRISLGVYNHLDELKEFVSTFDKVISKFSFK